MIRLILLSYYKCLLLFQLTFIDMEELNLVGIEFYQAKHELPLSDKSVDYHKLGNTFRKLPPDQRPQCPEPSTTYTYCRPALDTICHSPLFELTNGLSDAYIAHIHLRTIALKKPIVKMGSILVVMNY